jgi:gluconate 5-dehydrogenase
MISSSTSEYLVNLFNLTGKVALITGSSRGLGRTFAEALGRAGAQIIINSRNKDQLNTTVSELSDSGLDVRGFAFDVTDVDAIDEAIGDVESEMGRIDILVNNAGINIRAPLEDMDISTWRTVLDTNLTSAFLVSRRIARGMIERKDGRIINICSLLSAHARKTIAPYCAAKSGLKMLTMSMATEWGQHGIRANAIGPGYFNTEMNRSLYEDPEFDGWIRGRTPMARWGLPKELIGAAIYLASDASSFTSGQLLYVDGGVLATL